MKKCLTLLVCLAMLLSFSTVATSAADYRKDINYWILDAVKTDEILEMNAGYMTETWTVPYLTETPVMDGEVKDGEYREFKNFEDYLSLMARLGTPEYGNTEEEFQDFLAEYETFSSSNDFIRPYWGWDGTYLYMAFEVKNLNGFYCTPPDTFYLFAYNCLQVGIGDVDTYGNDFVELGFGVNSETGAPITHVWLGEYTIDASADFGGSYDEQYGIVTYECRIDVAKTVGRYYDEGETVKPGDEMKFSWLLSVNGINNRPNNSMPEGEEWQVSFCHGIGGPYSHKVGEYFAVATFGGPEGETLPETEPDTETETTPETTVEAETTVSAETTTPTETTASATTAAPTDDGCASVVAISGVLFTAAAAAVALRKREN